ncbi:hypothetical protein CPB86DRAFT_682685, partial [Serendipita vermifera]
VVFENVLFVPDLKTNLLSVPTLTRTGEWSVLWEYTTATFMRYKQVTMVAAIDERNQGWLDARTVTTTALAKRSVASKTPVPLQRWHERLAHRDPATIKKLAKSESI